MDKLDFLDEPEGSNEEVQPVEQEATEQEAPLEEQSEPEQPAEQDGQPRDEHGRFAPKEATETEQVEAAPSQPPPGFVPVGTVQALRAELQALKQAQQPQQPPPDFYEDQQGYLNQTVINPIQNQMNMMNAQWSRRFAEQSHGAGAVDAAYQWGLEQEAADPAFSQRVLNSGDPFGTLIEEHKRHQVMSKLSDPSRIDAFLAWEQAQKQAQAAPQQPAQGAPPQQSMPRRSIASSLPSSGGAAHVPTGPGQAFDSIFKE